MMKVINLHKGTSEIKKINGVEIRNIRNKLYWSETDGTYLYVCLEDPPINKLDEIYKSDSIFWNNIFLKLHSDYKVLLD